MSKNKKSSQGLYYGDYLHLEKLLGTQKLKSANPLKKDKGQHDEMLFIIVHQVYELWFKQIIHELNLVLDIFNKNYVEDKELALVVSKLERVVKIQGPFEDYIKILESMTPMDFLEFRDLLVPASGFQSVQFRQIEIILGLPTHKRFSVDRHYFLGRLNAKDKKFLLKVEGQKSLLQHVEDWLERIPFTQGQGGDFWSKYKKAIGELLKREKEIIESAKHLRPEQKKSQIKNLNLTKKNFNLLFDPKLYKNEIKEGRKRFSQKAILGALFILLYRDEPILQMPYRFLSTLMDIDENFTSWRYRHALLAKRMLGNKVGTGGSSGHVYLKNAADHNRAFEDLFNLSTFLIPRSALPLLSETLKRSMGFHFSGVYYEH